MTGRRSGHPIRGRLAPSLLTAFLVLNSEGCSSRICPAVAFVLVPPSSTLSHGCQSQAPHREPLFQLSVMQQHHDAVDDDDVSQHEFMITEGQDELDSAALGRGGDGGSVGRGINAEDKANENTKRKGYRPIEDWHDEYKSKNADEFKAITHLRREKARWGKTFESLGGDGI